MSSLWLGGDHLVYVKGRGFLVAFVEEYQRFRLSDVQAISIARTSRLGKGFLYLFVLLVCSAIATLILTLSEDLNIATSIFVSLFVLGGLAFLALLIRHLILGPTCVCDLQTGLTRERITPLNRYHRSLETIRLIEGLVRENQAGLSIEDVAARDSGVEVQSSRGFSEERFQIPKMVPVAFAAFLLIGLGSLAALHLDSIILTGGMLLMIVIASTLLTVSLISVVRKPTPESIRTSLWVLMGIHFVVVGAGAVYYLMAATGNPAYTVGISGPLEAFTGIASDGGAAYYVLFVLLFFGYFLAGIIGTLQTGKWKRQLGIAASLDGPVEVKEEIQP
jgi:hypothetical protein